MLEAKGLQVLTASEPSLQPHLPAHRVVLTPGTMVKARLAVIGYLIPNCLGSTQHCHCRRIPRLSPWLTCPLSRKGEVRGSKCGETQPTQESECQVRIGSRHRRAAAHSCLH